MTGSPALDPVIAALSYQVIEMLRSFQDGNSFKEIGAQFECDERTVSRQLLDLDAAFMQSQGQHILQRGAGRRTYELTGTGKALVAGLEPLTQAALGAIYAAASVARRIPVVCTSNCLSHLDQIISELPKACGFQLIPEPKRSADIDLRHMAAHPSEAQVFLLSALMSSRQNPALGQVCQWNADIEVLPIAIDELRLLSAEDLRLPYRSGPVTVRDVFDARVTLLTPRGGAAWDFLNRSFPEWKKLRPFQHIEVPDLDYGLRCLAKRLVPRSAMIVHGVNEDVLHGYNLSDVHTYEFAADGSDRLWAVTGVYHHTPGPNGSDHHDPSDIVWRTAQNIWAEKERSL